MKSTVVPEGLEGPPGVPLWRNRDYMLLWSGQAVSLTGTVISQAAYPLLVWDLTNSAAQVGLAGGLATIPYVFPSLLAGALVDRGDRKRGIILCDARRDLTQVRAPA